MGGRGRGVQGRGGGARRTRSEEQLEQLGRSPVVACSLPNPLAPPSSPARSKPHTQVADMSQEVRDAVGTRLLKLTLKELFEWRFMQVRMCVGVRWP